MILHYLYYCDGFELVYTVVSGSRIEGSYLCYCDAFELAYTVVSDNWIAGLYSSAYSYFWTMYSLSFSLHYRNPTLFLCQKSCPYFCK